MNHSPGPWSVDPDDLITDADTVFTISVVSPGGHTVATVCAFELVQLDERTVGAGQSSQADLDQARADALLIAAAVEMRDLLIRAADAIEVLDGTSVENEKLLDDYRALMARLA